MSEWTIVVSHVHVSGHLCTSGRARLSGVRKIHVFFHARAGSAETIAKGIVLRL